MKKQIRDALSEEAKTGVYETPKKAMKILLTDEEIKGVFDRAKRTPTAPVDCHICRVNLAKAQLKKVVGWLKENGYELEINVTHDKGVLGRHVYAIQHMKWQALLKEVK